MPRPLSNTGNSNEAKGRKGSPLRQPIVDATKPAKQASAMKNSAPINVGAWLNSTYDAP